MLSCLRVRYPLLIHRCNARPAWTIPPIFSYLQKEGDVSQKEMYRVFNMGIGMVLITAPYYTKAILATLKKSGERARLIGKVISGSQEVLFRKKG